MSLKQSATRYKQKTEIFLAIRPPTYWKPDSCFWVIRKGKKRIKANLLLNLQELKLRLFSCKNISQIASKTFATQFIFTDHLNHKTVNNTTCRTPSANPRQLWAHQLKNFRTVAIIFRGFQDFLIYLAKYFSSPLNSRMLITQQCFTRAL